MSSSLTIFTSSIGRKIVMAVTGLILYLFVLGHMLGNLQIFLGPEALNRYAEFLQNLGELLWVVRIALLTAFVVHIVFSIALTLENWRARPVSYQYSNTVQASLASRTMIYTGSLVLLFVLFHLLHFTLGKIQPEYYHIPDPTHGYDVYAMVIHGFQNKLYSGLYILLMICLGFHLSHAFGSAFETLGCNHPKYQSALAKLSLVLGWGIALGYIVVPLSVLLGIVGLPAGGN